MSDEEQITLAHGSGGVLSRKLVRDRLLKFFTSPLLSELDDSALLEMDSGRTAFTTDTYVVDPIFFPGGDIGKLAVCGTVNDLAVVGARPRFISCALILEEGFPSEDLDRILASMQAAADEADVEVVTGDTKVVPRGKADGIFINTAGVGTFEDGAAPPRGEPRPGDRVVVSGPVGDHGAAVLGRREGLNLDSSAESDCAPLTDAAAAVREAAERLSFMRDLTRGGLSTILNEAAGDETGIVIREEDVPVRPSVRSLCELLGVDALYLACEGRLAAIVDAESADEARDALRAVPGSEGAEVVGEVTEEYAGKVACETAYGTRRLLQMLSGEQLPRIC
ncbi:MAG: hydrogenase expression/formation protein HypE [Planctomycetota bacterium]